MSVVLTVLFVLAVLELTGALWIVLLSIVIAAGIAGVGFCCFVESRPDTAQN